MKKILCIALALSLTGCATGQGFGKGYRPIVDMKGHDMNIYNADLTECQQQYAQQISAGRTALAGALFGALLGVAIAAPFGMGGKFNANMAGLGAGAGAAAGADGSFRKQETIIMRCLQGRGYSVLG